MKIEILTNTLLIPKKIFLTPSRSPCAKSSAIDGKKGVANFILFEQSNDGKRFVTLKLATDAGPIIDPIAINIYCALKTPYTHLTK